MEPKVSIVFYKEKEREYNSILEMLKPIWKDKGFVIELDGITESSLQNEYNGEEIIPESDFIMSIDMAGFQVDTLLGYYAYNLRNSLQLHLIINPASMNSVPPKEMALNLFYYIPKGSRDKVVNPERILKLNEYQPLKMKNNRVTESEYNSLILAQMIDDVLAEK